MRLISYVHEGQASFGVQTGDGVMDIPAAWPGGPANMRDLLTAGRPAMDELAQRLATCSQWRSPASLKLVAPLEPSKLLGLAVNYVEHHREFERGHDLPDDPRRHTTPRPFLMPPTVLADPDQQIDWPLYSEEVDYEVELAVVIGATCKGLSPEQARDVIAGYTIANDISARSCTHKAGRSERPKDAFFDWLHGKWSDGFCPLGPAIVTADELADPMDLAIQCDVNGQRRQDANTGMMIFDVYELVAFCSQLMTLVPGDVIATGTPSGVGKATGNLLAPGDTVTCRIEGIGELTNTIGPRPDAFYAPCSGN